MPRLLADVHENGRSAAQSMTGENLGDLGPALGGYFENLARAPRYRPRTWLSLGGIDTKFPQIVVEGRTCILSRVGCDLTPMPCIQNWNC
jgi:hypothetical protein